MNEVAVHPLEKYFRSGVNYTTCPGCGNGIISQSLLRAIDELEFDFDRAAFVSGIGCSGWIPSPSYNADLLHVTHGRSLAAATGLKLAAPGLTVFVIVGDGDLSAIGGNHFIHAARRNIDLKVICVNNRIYGMTSGQVAPTTPYGSKTTTTPLGSVERSFDLSSLAISAGATFVARWTTYHARALTRTIKKAMAHRGFSFIEVISQCPVQYGKVIGLRNDAVGMLMQYRQDSVSVSQAKDLSKEELQDKIVVGELHVEQGVPELSEEIKRLQREAGAR
jgi:2-oxoglutarate ferredoxin oxidoreductase subunit beta